MTSAPISEQPATGAGAPFRRLVGGAIIAVVLLVELALAAAWVQLTDARHDLERADGLSIAFTDVQRMFQELEYLAATEPTFDTPEVDTQLDLLDRQVQVVATRLNDPATTPQLGADIQSIITAFRDVVELRQNTPEDVETALALAARGQQTSQAAVDRTATITRNRFIADAVASERTATIVAAVGALLLVAGAGLVWWVLLRYQRSFDETWRIAVSRQEQLETSNARLAALADTRERFVSVLSHELRSPLAVIGAVGETLTHHGDRLDPATRDNILRSLRRQVARQQRMIDDLLLVARHANTDPEPMPTAVDVEALLALVLRDDGLDGIIATVDVEPGTFARADEHHLEQVLHNLVRNAEKYGGSRVLVEARTEDREVVIIVSDDGEGVPPELQSTLFEPFTQGTGDRGGIGLGLSITRQLVEANGGRISYRDGEHGGAVFELRVPAVTPALA